MFYEECSMLKPIRMLLIFSALAAAPAGAQTPDIRPGLWEISMSGIGEVRQEFCVTPEMVRNMRDLTMQRDPGSDCSHSNEKVSGNTRTFDITCTTPAQYKARVRLKVDSPDRFTMTQDFTMDLGGQQQKGSATMDYRRIGECR
jgi:hypothetical protein